jgi:hypothetical protein
MGEDDLPSAERASAVMVGTVERWSSPPAVLLGAAVPKTAQNLLWEALASSHGNTLINCITGANEWAVDVGLKASLHIGQEGYLGISGMRLPAPSVPSGHFQ